MTKDFSTATGVTFGWKIYLSGGSIRLVMSGENYPLTVIGPTLTQDLWQHVVVMWDGTWNNNSASFYKNGVYTGSGGIDAGANTKSDDSSIPLYIGGNPGSTFGYSGNLDDVRVYNRILTAKEVDRLYKLGEGSKVNTTATTTGNTGLVGHWTFDGPDLTTATATDKSGRGNNGVLTNGPLPIIGKTGQGLSFDGSNDFVSVSSGVSTTDLPRMTVSAWFKKSTSGNIGSIVGKMSSFYGWDLYYCSSVCGGSLQTLEFAQTFDESGATWRTPARAVALNEWVHVVVSYDRTSSSNIPAFYINGVITTSTARGGAASGVATSDDGVAITIGKSDDGAFNGLIDDVRVYNRILTADEVSDLYTGSVGTKMNVTATSTGNTSLVGHWTFDGPDLTTATATDKSGSGNHAALYSGPTPLAGKLGQGLNFSSAAFQYLAVSPSGSINDISKRTVSVWVKPSSLPGNAFLLSKASWYVQIQASGSLMVYEDFSGTDGYWTSGAAVVPLGQWTHVAVTYDTGSAGNVPVIYVNGLPVAVSALFSPTNSHRTDSSYAITMAGISSPLDGALDDVRIYNRILTADEIADLYGASR